MNPAAELNKLRWKNTTKAERKAHSDMMIARREEKRKLDKQAA